MDPSSSQALRKVREDVMASRSWSRLQRELLSQLRQSAGEERGGQLGSFASLSPSEKLAAVGRAMEAVGETSAYARLQTQVASAVDRHFGPLVFQPSQIPQDISTTSTVDSPQPAPPSPLAEACSQLLQSSPHLKHSLKYALNHPLPPQLRPSAWRALLHRPKIQGDFLAACKELEPRGKTEMDIARRCRATLEQNEVFKDLARSSACLRALQMVTLYWSQRSSEREALLDSELLLCLPFVHVWREELERQVVGEEEEEEGLLLLAEIAAEYVHFMEMLPSSISTSAVSYCTQTVHISREYSATPL